MHATIQCLWKICPHLVTCFSCSRVSRQTEHVYPVLSKTLLLCNATLPSLMPPLPAGTAAAEEEPPSPPLPALPLPFLRRLLDEPRALSDSADSTSITTHSALLCANADADVDAEGAVEDEDAVEDDEASDSHRSITADSSAPRFRPPCCCCAEAPGGWGAATSESLSTRSTTSVICACLHRAVQGKTFFARDLLRLSTVGAPTCSAVACSSNLLYECVPGAST